MERGKVERVSADELSEVDSSFNQQESPRFPPWTSSQINAMILPQTRNICDNTQMATLNDEMCNGRETRPSAPLLTSMSEPNMRQIQQCDTNRTQETDKLDRLFELFADMKRDVSQKIDAKLDALGQDFKQRLDKSDEKFDVLNRTMTENFERTTKQMTELNNTTQKLSQRFETLSNRVTKQEETLVTFTHETKNNIARCENQLTQIVNVQQEVNTRVEELAQAHTSASSTQGKLTEEVGNITQQLTMVVLEQTHLKEKIEKLEDRADLASLNNDTNMAERIVHECKLCDDYLDKKLETITQDILSKTKTHVKDGPKTTEDEVTKLRDNGVPCLAIGANASLGNDKTAKTMANDTDRTPIVKSPISNQNYNVPPSFPPNEQYYDTTPRVASDTNYVNTVMPTGMADDTLIGVPENDVKTFLNFLDQMDVVYRGDSRHSNFIHISNQNQHPPQRNRSDGGWWNHPSAPRHNTMPARETYSNGNVYDSRNNRRYSWNNNNNNNYHPYQNGNYKQNENYRQYNNNNNRRRENNRYNPGYFDRNVTYNRHNYHQNISNPNNHRQNMWNTQNSRMTNHNPPRNPPRSLVQLCTPRHEVAITIAARHQLTRGRQPAGM
ncbi:GATA zinc finger domain-containing protein 4-like [Schistocerca nitens]|uniref:GATA zinc finger domain-containing protein 4-like n=1 Tax=Schistocerca nitens TaxID=7011 RepID=UPI002117E3DA|nr:GATA zinc finger domain-containing protein 4-like [Schistocerca nitens]XP_049800311.1 GATA zinc finger domain-containing protein 4-like [Schistocerca nitens]